MSSWNTTLSDIRIVEHRIQNKLQEFSTYVRKYDGISTDIENQSEQGEIYKETINTLFKNYLAYLDELQRKADNTDDNSYSTIVQRQKNVLRDFKKDYKRMDDNLQIKMERLGLLNPNFVHQMTNEESEMQQLLKERGATRNALQMADEYLDQASESHSLLINQRGRLNKNRGRLGGIASRFPIVNKLMNSIQDQRKRDNLIVAIFIAFCIFFCIWYVSPRKYCVC